ncbi:major capsid protein [Paracidovorax valerianellae]|uniref:Bacteriophage coat protein B n=1 Tax=Paracidovorax valerianellae TaxID=187868 RepID=A0A1G7EGK8_9BURK|nr:major capsid protein [Paracidovorax valerianellae]MDA8446350.1 major capsid protein [Paracidovorax valerianellae]SDE62778.1 Bacteriophage coat protein B [Paracidovorax valerianellae]
MNRKNLQTLRYAAIAAGTSLAVSAHAAIPENVNTALGSLSTDALTVAGIVLAAIVAVYAFKFIRKGL